MIITKWLFIYQDRYIFSALIALNLVFNKDARRPEASWLFLLILFFTYSFAFIYPYFLPRYLLPALPYFYLLVGWSLMAAVQAAAWRISAALLVLLFMVWSCVTQPFSGTAELNLRYLGAVKLHKEICEILMKEFQFSRILTSMAICPGTSEPAPGLCQPGLERYFPSVTRAAFPPLMSKILEEQT